MNIYWIWSLILIIPGAALGLGRAALAVYRNPNLFVEYAKTIGVVVVIVATAAALLFAFLGLGYADVSSDCQRKAESQHADETGTRNFYDQCMGEKWW